jgi:transcriptional regulator
MTRLKSMTYVPKWLKQPTTGESIGLAEQIGFASVAISLQSQVEVAHVPVYVDRSGECLKLRFHLSMNNPLADLLASSTALLMFHGPNGYISPRWYDHENVPTWDYAVVHMTGTPTTLDRNQLKAHVLELVERYDAALEVSDDYIEQILNYIRGFEIVAPEVQPVVKLSQDKSPATIDGIITGLGEGNHNGDNALANAVAWARRFNDD